MRKRKRKGTLKLEMEKLGIKRHMKELGVEMWKVGGSEE